MGIVGETSDAIEKATKALKGNPHGAQAVDLVAQSAEILATTLRNVLLPFAAINYGIDKARQYFETRFGPELQEKLGKVPPGDVVEPKAVIAGPVMQGIAYSFEDDSLRILYLNLLTSAMDGGRPDSAHPAYVEIIKQLSSRDARLLAGMREPAERRAWVYPAVRVRAKMLDGSGHSIAYQVILDAGLYFPEEHFSDVADLTALIENWVRLGLFTVDYTSQLMTEGAYDFTDRIPGLDGFRDALHAKQDRELEFDRGILRLTDFGSRFFRAVVET